MHISEIYCVFMQKKEILQSFSKIRHIRQYVVLDIFV